MHFRTYHIYTLTFGTPVSLIFFFLPFFFIVFLYAALLWLFFAYSSFGEWWRVHFIFFIDFLFSCFIACLCIIGTFTYTIDGLMQSTKIHSFDWIYCNYVHWRVFLLFFRSSSLQNTFFFTSRLSTGSSHCSHYYNSIQT